MERGLVMVLMCTWACSVGGDYGLTRPSSYIVLPAGPSKQHKWAGYGYSDHLPLHVPKPYYIPKWIPHVDRTYTAFWVAQTPAPPTRGHAYGRRKPAGVPLPPPVGAKPVQGFGPLKGSSVVASSGGVIRGQDSAPVGVVSTPLLRPPVPKTPLPLATLPPVSPGNPLTTYAPAPLGQPRAPLPPAPRFASPPAPAAPAFLPPKAEDVIPQSGVATNSVVPGSGGGGGTAVSLLLVCTLLTLDLTLASYRNNHLNLIIRPAGRSRSFKWLGRGDVHSIPLHVPRPVFIPRWIPKGRPEYVARWVPTTPPAYTQQSHPKFSGFGAPKGNSIVEAHSSPAYSMVPPPIASVAPPTAAAPPPPPPTGYAPPRPDDIITEVGAAPTGSSSPDVTIPETAIRSALSAAPLTLQEPIFSAFVQDKAATAVQLRDFRPLDPNSVISLEDNSLDLFQTNFDDPVDSALSDGTLNVLQPASSQTLLVLDGEIIEGVPTQFDPNPTTSTAENDDPLFIVEPDEGDLQATLTPLTATLVLDDKVLQSSQDNSGKSFVFPTVSPHLLGRLHSKDVAPENVTRVRDDIQLETVRSTPVPTQGSQVSDDPQLRQGFRPSPAFDINQDSQFNQGFQPNPQFISSEHFNPDPEITVDETVETNPEFVSTENLVVDQEFISIEDFLRNPEFTSDENSLLDVAVSQGIQFDDDFESSRIIQSDPEGLLWARSRSSPSLGPTLVAPPASPPLLTGRAMFSHNTLPLASFIPQPLPIPVGPLASITLDFPQEGPAGLRQSRGLTGPSSFDLQRETSKVLLPFGARLRPRPVRRHYSRAAAFRG